MLDGYMADNKQDPIFAESKKSTAISVGDGENDELTPITQKPIPKVDASKWDEMSLSELYDQKLTLEARHQACLQYGHADAANQIQRGLQRLQLAIDKADQGVNLI
jgi:hypothetical protein